MQFKMAFNTALVEYYLDLNNLLQACDRSILTNFGSLNTNMTLRNVHNDVVKDVTLRYPSNGGAA